MKPFAIILAFLGTAANAADWSDSYISYSHGTKYHEPANPQDITKDVITLGYIGGNGLGSNFFAVDLLKSDENNPANKGTHGAQEVYVVLRNTLSFSKLSGSKLAVGPVRDFALESGIDFSSKNDAFGGAEFKWMLGPKVDFEVPGYLSMGILALKDTGNNSLAGVKVNSPWTWRLSTLWSFDFNVGAPMIFKGWATYTGTRGKDGFGNGTHPEVWSESALMVDVGSLAGASAKKYYAGLGYQYIHNKFNNSANLVGTKVSAPSLRLEAHF
jgi:nucleoside-specific outer membrane channel protein Tsx